MPLVQDRTSLKNILLWISDVLASLVATIERELAGREPVRARLASELRDALPTIQRHIKEKIAELDKMKLQQSPEWLKLKSRGLTDEQLRWKLTLLKMIFAVTPPATQPLPTAVPTISPTKKQSAGSKKMGWLASKTPLLKQIIDWIKSILGSLGLDIAVEFIEGVENVIEHQLPPTSLTTIGEPRNW